MNVAEPWVDRPSYFSEVRNYWPKEILSDEGAFLDQLHEIYWPLDGRSKEDDWLGVGLWSFHQAASERAEQMEQAGAKALQFDEISFDDFDRWLRENLADESWADEQELWLASSIRN